MLRSRQSGSWIAAGLIATLTASVFFVLQNYGPESTVRRFHEAVVRKNFSELSRVSSGSIRQATDRVELDPATAMLWNFVTDLVAQGARLRLRDVQRGPGFVWVAVYYVVPGRAPVALPWLARHTPQGEWKVDTLATAWRWRNPLGNNRLRLNNRS